MEPEIDASPDAKPQITMAMLRAGRTAYENWDPDTEDPILLIAAVYWAMTEARALTLFE